MIWNPEYECMTREQIEALQLERLKQTLGRVWEHAPAQKRKLAEAGAEPGDVKSLEDIAKLPFTVKTDFTGNYPYGMLAVPRREVVRMHGTSGTTGKPSVSFYTRRDMDVWSELIARLASAVGVTPDDVVQISFGYGMFTGGFGLHQGMEKIGALVVPLSSGNTERQIMMWEDMQVTVMVATPSYALYLGETVRDMGVRDRLKLRVGLFGGEGCTPEMRARIEETLGITATNNYGLCEIIGPGVSGECELRDGLHIAEDHFYPEIIDPKTGKALPLGEQGELVLTTLTKEAVPVIRYRTRDITRLIPERCACGRTHMRMTHTLGRSDDMLIIKGVNVFPSQIESVLIGLRLPAVGPHYLLYVRHERIDTLELQVELVDGGVLERFSELDNIRRVIQDKLRSVLDLTCKVTLVEPRTIERFQGKASRVIDLRNK
ncbi:MAG: phenylacetate--CoA ligase [Oscillospiraceae bacterium]|nr:phenylacetate--CoA ligase [Oscillospiraceae bacterium]